MKAILKDFKYIIAIKIENEIVGTNAEFVDNSEIKLFEQDFNEMIKNEVCSDVYFNNYLNRDLNNIYTLKELVKECPSIKFEVDK